MPIMLLNCPLILNIFSNLVIHDKTFEKVLNVDATSFIKKCIIISVMQADDTCSIICQFNKAYIVFMIGFCYFKFIFQIVIHDVLSAHPPLSACTKVARAQWADNTYSLR